MTSKTLRGGIRSYPVDHRVLLKKRPKWDWCHDSLIRLLEDYERILPSPWQNSSNVFFGPTTLEEINTRLEKIRPDWFDDDDDKSDAFKEVCWAMGELRMKKAERVLEFIERRNPQLSPVGWALRTIRSESP